MAKFNIKKIAIVGGGPGGLASLYEFLHTSKDGESTVGGSAGPSSFDEIVVFEQKGQAGGIWSSSTLESDPKFLSQDVLETEEYNSPRIVLPPKELPADLEKFSVSSPYVREIPKNQRETEWKNSGVYPDLFTNIPARFIRFSYWPNESEFSDKSREIYPFLTQEELIGRFSKFIDREGLQKYVRNNSRVENLSKNDNNKWVVSVKHTVGDTEEWYQEEFDAVVIANGHYTIPNIPKIQGLSQFNKTFPGVLIHSKSYRDPKIFKDKKVLVVGGGISAANLVQYVYPIAKETVVSRRGPHLVFPWIDSGLSSEGIIVKPAISAFNAEKGEVEYSDGTRDSGFDVILFTTGYHYHYPFLRDYLSVVHPSNLSRVSGLYYDTFSIEDPTLAAVGVAVSAINFHSIEASAAAIAGVWSNVGELPSKQDELDWLEARIGQTGDNIFYHYYPHSLIKEDFVDPLLKLAAKKRPNPLGVDGEHIHEVDEGFDYLEKLFYKYKGPTK